MKKPPETELERLYSIVGFNEKPHENPKLMKALEQAFAKKNIFLFGPSGYGKTTSVRQWLGKKNVKQTWLELNEKDNDLNTFCEHLALMFVDLQPDNKGLAIAIGHTVSDTNYESLLFSAEKALCLGEMRQVIVFDNFQTITNKDVMVKIVDVTKRLPENISILVLSRDEPDGIFSDLILRFCMSVINKDQLVF